MAAQTATGADPFAGAPGQSSASPTPTTPGATPDPAATAGMPTFTVTGTKSKTFGGIPTNQFQDQLRMDTGARVPGLSPEDQGFAQGPNFIPAYKDGDQWAPASDPDPDTVRNLQIQMINGGLLTLKQVHLGIWDKTSADAYAKVLAQANLTGVSGAIALDNYVKSEASLPPAGLSPEDVKGIAQQSAQAFLGRDMNDAELAKFTTAFQAAFASDQPTSAAGTQQIAQDVLTKENPKGVMAASLHKVSQRALQVLSSPAVNLPSPQ